LDQRQGSYLGVAHCTCYRMRRLGLVVCGVGSTLASWLVGTDMPCGIAERSHRNWSLRLLRKFVDKTHSAGGASPAPTGDLQRDRGLLRIGTKERGCVGLARSTPHRGCSALGQCLDYFDVWTTTTFGLRTSGATTFELGAGFRWCLE